MEDNNEYVKIEQDTQSEVINEAQSAKQPKFVKANPEIDLNRRMDPSIYSCFSLSERMAFKIKRAFRSIEKETASELIESIREVKPVKDIDALGDHVICLKILKVSLLEFQMYLNYPYVETHVVDLHTGEYFESNEVVENNREDEMNIDGLNKAKTSYRTKPFDLFHNRDAIAEWKEPVNVNFKEGFKLSPNTLLLFEIWDDTNQESGKPEAKDTKQENLVRVAWGYLIPFGVYQTRTGMIDIQLYKHKFNPKKYKPNDRYKNVPPVYFDFLWLNRTSFDTSLSIEISYKSKETLAEETNNLKVVSQIHPFELETNKMVENKLKIEKDIDNKNKLIQMEFLDKIRFRDFEGSKIPNTLYLSLPTDGLGSSVTRFSTSGRFLAYSAIKQDKFSYLKIYNFEENCAVADLYNHNDIINDLDWHQNDKFIMSCSSDGTIKIFELPSDGDVITKDINSLRSTLRIEILEKSPVYCSRFFYTDNGGTFIASSTADGRVSLFVLNIANRSYKKLIEININTQTDTAYGNTILTLSDSIIIGDSLGRLGFFKFYLENEKLKVEKEKEITIREIKGSVINSIYYMKDRDYILVQTRDNLMRLINLKNKKIVNRFLHGSFANCNIKATVSTDSQFIVSGSENSKLKIWDLYCTDCIEFGLENEINGVVLSCDWNPAYNALAVVGFGSQFNVKVFVS